MLLPTAHSPYKFNSAALPYTNYKYAFLNPYVAFPLITTDIQAKFYRFLHTTIDFYQSLTNSQVKGFSFIQLQLSDHFN